METIYIDRLFALNFIIDYLILLGSARICGIFMRRGRYLLAGNNLVLDVGFATTIVTNGQLQMFYWTEVRNFLSGYGAYASMLGLDNQYTRS